MSEHRITATLTCFGIVGPKTFKADLDYTYEPGATPDDGPELDLIKVTPVEGTIYFKHSRKEITAIAENWLSGEGYDMACQLAERERAERPPADARIDWSDWE